MRGFVFILIALMMAGCRAKYIPVEKVVYDSLFYARIVHDSVYIRDSVYIHEKGDTVFKYRDKYVYLDRLKVDTIYIDRWKDREVPVPVERELSWWEKVKMDYGGWVMLTVLAWLGLVILRWIIRRTRKE